MTQKNKNQDKLDELYVQIIMEELKANPDQAKIRELQRQRNEEYQKRIK